MNQKTSKKSSPRAAAAKALAGVIFNQRSLSATLPQAVESLDPSDRPLAQEISYGVLRHYDQLNNRAKQLLKRPFKKKDGALHALILSGFYELKYMRTPAHATISESVNATKLLGRDWARGGVNALLRGFQRDIDSGNSLPEHHNHPQWMIDEVKKSWPNEWEQVLNNNNQRPPMTLRVNLSHNSSESYLAILADEALTATQSSITPSAITLERGVPVLALPGFEDGDISVQDEAPQQAAELLNPQAGETVLDACAAPGGKTAHILERIAAAGEGELKELVALDLKPERLQRIDDNLARLNFTASTVVADATDSGWRKSGSLFDRILIDAPCSGSGVIRRNPDIKLLRRQSDIVTLVDNQRAILESCWALLQSGGTLLYATCSIFPQENEEQIQQFLNAQQDSEALPIEQEWGRSTGAGRQILPGENGMDGFYYALLRKRVE